MSSADVPVRHDDGPPDEAGASRWSWSALLPRTRGQTALGLAALLFLAGSVGHLVGSRTADDRPAAGSVAVGFLYDMSAHHMQALVMAEIQLSNGESAAVGRFAKEILRTQSYEVGLMSMRLGMWGHDPEQRPERAMEWMGMPTAVEAMPGMATDDEIAALTKAKGADADALFVALMSDHHRGGVAMAEHAAEHARDPWVRDTAATMAKIQAEEIVEMERARVAAGLPADPAGYVADDIEAHTPGQETHAGH